MILPAGTATYQSDAGMCGDYNSVIGMEKTEPMRRFITGMSKSAYPCRRDPATLSRFVHVETDDRTGQSTSGENDPTWWPAETQRAMNAGLLPCCGADAVRHEAGAQAYL